MLTSLTIRSLATPVNNLGVSEVTPNDDPKYELRNESGDDSQDQ